MILDIIKIIILSIVEAFTEFIPVSSTGHMIIVEKYINLSSNRIFVNSFQVIIQLGAIIAVIFIFFDRLFIVNKKKEEIVSYINLYKKIIIATLPAIILGFLFDDIIEKYFFNSLTVSFMLIIYGLFLILLENKNKKTTVNKLEDISYNTAFLIGIFQCFAMIPGTSRSAATIIGAMLLGLNRIIATEFSFFLAIPIMLGATILKLLKNLNNLTTYEISLILLGLVITFILSLIIIKKFLEYIKKNDFKIFGYYRIILGIIILLLSFI